MSGVQIIMRFSFPNAISGFPLLHPEHLAKLFFAPFSSPAISMFKPFEESPDLSGEMHVKDGTLDVRIFRDRNKLTYNLTQPSSWYQATVSLKDGAICGNVDIQYSATDGKVQGISVEPDRLPEVRMPLVLAAAHARFQELIAPYQRPGSSVKHPDPLGIPEPSPVPVPAQELSHRFQDLLKKSVRQHRASSEPFEIRINDDEGPKLIKGELMAYARLWVGPRYHDGYVVRTLNSRRIGLVSVRTSTLPGECRRDRFEILRTSEDLASRSLALFGARLRQQLMSQLDGIPVQLID